MIAKTSNLAQNGQIGSIQNKKLKELIEKQKSRNIKIKSKIDSLIDQDLDGPKKKMFFKKQHRRMQT